MTRRTLIGSVGGGLMLALAATCLLAARPGVVTTVDEQRYEGDVTERGDEVVIRTHGVDTVLARGRVAGIDYSTYLDRFRAAIDRLDAADVGGRVALAREAFDRREYPLAQAALDAALEINPLDRDARQLQALVSTQLQLEGRPKRPPAAATDATAAAPRPPQRRPRGLDEFQANRVRQLELRSGEAARILFRDGVRKRFVDAQPGMNYGGFARRDDVSQALTILAAGTPDMVDDVIVRNDPASIQLFGRKLHGAIIQGCASSPCHGGAQAGGFRLLSGTPDAATIITNFYLLTRYVQDVDADANDLFDAGSVSMIDRGNARASLLYQHALPRARARVKHPPVRGWDGLFRGDDDRLARELTRWMESDLTRLQPDYGFTFELPTDAATRPTSNPTSGPATAPATVPATRPSDQD